jgi:MoaA/NifB/PqqE/SkfB family radical SAM enzyme
MENPNTQNLRMEASHGISLSRKSKEWTCAYNPFNSMKVLLWREHLEAIVKGEFLPPVTVDTDPTNLCNYKCIWCNSQDFREKHPAALSTEHLLKLADFYKEWGVRSTCVAGGGEPLINKGFSKFIKRLNTNNVESGIITNGSLMNDEHINVIANCSRWCGFSMDAGESKTYVKLKGLKDESIFFKVLKNIEKLAKARDKYKSNLSIAYKFLIHPDNCLEIYKAVDAARSLGVNDFHMRPVGWDNIYATRDMPNLDFTPVLEEAEAQIAAAQELETEDFHVYGVTHKFGEGWERKINFKKCLATPILATFGADGKCHLCFDMRGRDDLILCSHYPEPREILKVWGGEFHKRLIDSIDPKTCPRCTFGPYNEVIEKVIIQDNMCKYFP